MRQYGKLKTFKNKWGLMKRRRLTEEFKAKVAMEAINGQEAANEPAQEFGVHVNQDQPLEKAPY